MAKLRESQKQLIERLGVAHEQNGFPRAESRILSLLLISDVNELTFEEIHEYLGLSKSAVSNGLNSLMRYGRVEYITRPGDRKRYFRSNVSNFPKEIHNKFCGMLEIKEVMKEVLAQRDPETVEFNQGIAELIDFMDFMQGEIPALLKRWADRKAGA